MSRFWEPITVKELKKKVEGCVTNDGMDDYLDYRRLTPTVEKDLDKIRFDTENIDIEGWGAYRKDFLGYHTLPNKMPYLGVYSGGDWESPVYFIIYWDGKKLRGYIPEDGNLYNTDTKQAYGNDDEADLKNARKRWPNDQKLKDDDIDLQGYFDNYDFKAMKKDIMERILQKSLTKPQKSSKVNGLAAYTEKELLEELERRIKRKK